MNYNIQDASNKRIIIRKTNKESITDEDYQAIEKIKGIDRISKNDLLVDTYVSFESNQNGFPGKPRNIADYKGKLDIGELPVEENEIILQVSKESYVFSGKPENVLGKSYKLYQGNYMETKDLPEFKVYY